MSGKTLQIVQLGNPILRKKAQPLSKKEILSSEIQELIANMIHTMRRAPGVGLAAPQIGESLQLIVVEDMYHGHLTEKELQERERKKFPLHVIINPKLTITEEETAAFYEGCLSSPPVLAVVPRAKKVRVECLNEKAEPVVLEAQGWYARILQHEIDHLHGTLFYDTCRLNTLTTHDNYQTFWREH